MSRPILGLLSGRVLMSESNRSGAATPVAIVAIVLSLVAIGFSTWVYFQLPEEVSLVQLERLVSENTEGLQDHAEEVDELAASATEAFNLVWPRFSDIEADLSDIRTVALNAQSVAEDAYARAEEIEVDLGVCLYVQEIGVRYTYWSSIAFGGQEYMYRCER